MKQVIVLDAFDSCAECPCVTDDFTACKAYSRAFSSGMAMQVKNGGKCRPPWCKIKPLPEKKMVWNANQKYAIGFNKALEMIGGEA